MQRAFYPPIRAGSRAFFGVRFITKYTKSHEYIKVDNGVGTVGVTDFAQQALGDVVFVGLPEVGASFKKGCVLWGLATRPCSPPLPSLPAPFCSQFCPLPLRLFSLLT
jgi:hypothetical protein